MFGMSNEDIDAMNKDLYMLHKEEMEQHAKDHELLEKIKDRIPKEEFDIINEEMVLSENVANIKIVDKPAGDLQEEEGVKIWVNQNCGESGDNFTGTVCMELPNKRFIMWDYWM